MASNYAAARQKFVDMINAGATLGIPFIQKKVNVGKKFITEESRSSGIIHIGMGAGGTGGVESLTDAVSGGPSSGALDRTTDAANGKGSASYQDEAFYAKNGWEYLERTPLEKIFEIGNIDENIIRPRVAHLCQNVEKDLVTRNFTRAGGATVSSVIAFGALGKAMSMLETIKSIGNWTGFMSPMLKSILCNSALDKSNGMDVPDNILKEMYGKYAMGIYSNAEWVNEPFMPRFAAGMLNTTDGANDALSVKTEVSTQGASSIVITGFSSSGTIKKGTPFSIKGVYDVSSAGLKMEWEKVFIAQEDAAVSGGDATVKVLPIYFNDDSKGYRNNLFADSSKIASGAKIIPLIAANKHYDLAFLKEDEALNWTPFELEDVEGCKNTTTSTDDLTVQLCSGGSLLTRKNSMRLDCPYFGDIVNPQSCRLIFVLID